MYRSILAAVKPSASQTFLIEYAAALAARLDAELHACVVFDAERLAPREPTPPGGGAFKKARDEELLAAARTAADDAVGQASSAGISAGVRTTAEVVEGDVVDVLARRAHEHDLLVVGQAPGDRGDEPLLERILKGAPRPAIVFPKVSIGGSSVLVGYDGSPQAARALASLAASGLATYRMVHVVSCADDLAEAEATCNVACRFLTRHGLEAVCHPESLDRTPDAVLLDWARRCDAGLLVAGAFGHTAVHDWLFGSTARMLLRELPQPVLLDH